MSEPRVDASLFRQVSPCADCPFLRDGGVRHGLYSTSAYASYFTTGARQVFPCHKSVPKDDDRQAVSPWRDGQTVCAGGLIYAEKAGMRNNIMLFGLARGWYDPGKLEGHDAVCTPEELLALNATPAK